jgi:cytochrome c peroxidase
MGLTGEAHPRGSMSLANVAYAGTLAWANPGLFALEAQALLPMFGEHPIELGSPARRTSSSCLCGDVRYQRMFAEAFPDADDPFSLDSITKAIATSSAR